MDGFHLSRQFTFCHSIPRNFWYSFDQPRKDKRLSQPWSHPVVLNPRDPWIGNPLPQPLGHCYFLHFLKIWFKTESNCNFNEKQKCDVNINLNKTYHWNKAGIIFHEGICHCMKSVQIWSYFWSVFSCIRTEYWDLPRKSSYSVRIKENTDRK